MSRASPGRHPGPPGIRDGNGVAAVRTRQEPGTVPGQQGPSFLRDELVKFIESAKLGGSGSSLLQAFPDPPSLPSSCPCSAFSLVSRADQRVRKPADLKTITATSRVLLHRAEGGAIPLEAAGCESFSRSASESRSLN